GLHPHDQSQQQSSQRERRGWQQGPDRGRCQFGGMPMNARRCTGRARQAGMSLVEVLVSVLILSIGLLGIAAMQATALRNGQSSLERSQAVVQTYSVLDAIRADRDNVALYNTGGERCAAVAASAGATGAEAAANAVLNEWVAS